jgi:hypothetical protein
VDGVRGQGVRVVLGRDAAQGAGAGEVDQDGESQDQEGPDIQGQRKVVAEEDAVDGLIDDPEGGREHEAGFNEGGEAFDLAVTVVVIFVGGAVGHLDGEEGDGGGDEVDGGVRRLAQHAERAGEQAGEQLEQGDDRGGGDGK